MRLSRLPRQRGAAILTAMLTVVLVATLASATLWQQWRGVEIEAAERARTQSSWVLAGALDWARLILREDARKGGADHLAEPWAVPLAPARLSTFLAADRSDVLAADQTQDAFLSGQIIDLQSRLNFFNLVQSGKFDEPSRLAFARLFKLLSLPEQELTRVAEQLRRAQATGTEADEGSAATPLATALMPQDLEQLAWVGLSAPSMAALRPFVTILPMRTPVNLNTAPVEVIYACAEKLSLADAHALVSARSVTHFSSLQEAERVSGSAASPFNEAQHSVASRFFEIRGQLQLAQTTLQAQSVVQRDGMEVRTLWQKRGVLPPTSPLQ